VPAPLYRLADAQTADFGTLRFDAVYSRFGVMFFADPRAAFANLRRSLEPGGRLAFVCWRTLDENAWMRLPLESARALLGPAAARDPAAPGPFAFADAGRVREILRGAGFTAPSIEPHDAMIGVGGVEHSLRLALRVGPLGAALRERPELENAVADRVRTVLEHHSTPQGVRMQAGVWIVRAAA
jgi:SAM-dependent methyltransferase